MYLLSHGLNGPRF